MGETLSDNDFYAIVMGSLPASYDSYLSAINTTSSVLGTHLSADDLMLTIIEEYERRNLKSKGKSKEKMRLSMLTPRIRREESERVIAKTVARKVIGPETAMQKVVEKKDKVRSKRRRRIKKRKKGRTRKKGRRVRRRQWLRKVIRTINPRRKKPGWQW